MTAPRVQFVFNRAREERQRLFGEGRCPDDALYAFNAIRRRGFDAVFSDAGHDIRGLARLYTMFSDVLSGRGRRVGFHLRQARVLRGVLEGADLAFCTADSSALPILWLKKRGKIRTPVVYATIGLSQSLGAGSGVLARFYADLARRAERIVHFGRPEGEDLIREFAVDAARVRFVPFGVDTTFYSGAMGSDGPPLAFGFDPQRDWDLLGVSLGGTEVSVELCAYPDQFARIRRNERLHFAGALPMDELRDRVSRCAFVILPVRENRYTGATISLLSAMACEKAVIVSRTAAIAEGYGLADGENCVLVPPGDEEALRRAILRLRSDPGLCARIGAAARKHVLGGFTVEHMADRLAALFREVLA